MPPDQRPIPRFIAEPPHDSYPYGRWEMQLREHFVRAFDALDPDDDLGQPEELTWYPDRTFERRTYIPATAGTSEGFEIFGFVSFTRSDDGEPEEFWSQVDWTSETAGNNPDWKLDLSDDEIGSWQGPRNLQANIALVWGISLVPGGALVTAELGPTTTDQCELVEEHFTLVSLDAWTGDYLDVCLWGGKGNELARESLYEDDGAET